MPADVARADYNCRTGNADCITGRRAGLHQLVDDRIHQRLERRIDDIGRHADRGPTLALLVLALDQHPRHRFRAAVEDTHAIIDQLQPLDVSLVFAKILAQRDVERIDRTVALGGRDQRLAGDLDLHHRHRDGDALAAGNCSAARH